MGTMLTFPGLPTIVDPFIIEHRHDTIREANCVWDKEDLCLYAKRDQVRLYARLMRLKFSMWLHE